MERRGESLWRVRGTPRSLARGWVAVAAEEEKAQGGQADDAYGVEATRGATANL